jgi:glycine dehydrogenase subunit 1
LNCELVTLPTPTGTLNPDDVKPAINDQTVAVIAQSPNFFGHLEDMQSIADATKHAGAMFIASFDPISVGLFTKPADYGADIAVAEGQALGIPLGFGGPYLGILACRKEYVRKIPGRLVGQTIDRDGKTCWVLTLQAREQHIARNRATSNICTNQGLMALRGTVYLTALGPQGLRETAELCLRKAHYAADQLTRIPGVTLAFPAPFFKEFTIRVPGQATDVLAVLRKMGYHAGLPLSTWYPEWSHAITVAVTEKRTKAEIDGLAQALSGCLM